MVHDRQLQGIEPVLQAARVPEFQHVVLDLVVVIAADLAPGRGVQPFADLEAVKVEIARVGVAADGHHARDVAAQRRLDDHDLAALGMAAIDFVALCRWLGDALLADPVGGLGRIDLIDPLLDQFGGGAGGCQLACLAVDAFHAVDVVILGGLGALDKELLDPVGAVFGGQQARGRTNLDPLQTRGLGKVLYDLAQQPLGVPLIVDALHHVVPDGASPPRTG